jgi:hypothetical protein
MRHLAFALVLLVACGSPGGSGASPRPALHDASPLTFTRHVVPFGRGEGHHTEANALQLWSTVYLALGKR